MIIVQRRPRSALVQLLLALFILPISSGSASSLESDSTLSQFDTSPELELARGEWPNLLAGSSQAAALIGAGEKPKLIPLVAAESGYSENSSVNILCTVSQGHQEGLQFDWFKDGQLLAGGSALGQDQALRPALIEKHSDHSLLRISRVQSQHSGRYTCSAKNQFGQDSSSVNLMVNGNCSRPICRSPNPTISKGAPFGSASGWPAGGRLNHLGATLCSSRPKVVGEALVLHHQSK